MDYSEMTIAQIAQAIYNDWKKVYFGAVPYLEAMATLQSVKDNYFQDSGTSILRNKHRSLFPM